MRAEYFKILGIRITATNIHECKTLINNAINGKINQYIVIRDVHGIVQSHKSQAVKAAHDHAAYVLPDGMPLVWIGKIKGNKSIDRCYGPDLMLAIMDESVEKGYKHFFYGGNSGVANRLKSEMENRYPGVKIVGTYSPPFRPLNKSEELELENLIDELKPDILWIGLSTPKQELFMYENLNKLNAKLMIGVGAAFDFHTGIIKQAPALVQRLGFEWAYRIFQEPRRLWKRYLISIPTFIVYYILELLKLKNFNR
ncbi:WecB/TagA/CpsF family glycosyltransferase [Candidatus Neomarinimicrobiota bacterium]